jgi:hypothetical protein
MTQIALFWPKLLPVFSLFLKKPQYPCPFEILAEALNGQMMQLTCQLWCKQLMQIGWLLSSIPE